MIQPLFAHTHPDGPWEPLGEHAARVAARAALFARAFGAEELAHVAGLLHDVGKASAGFQAYLRGEGASVDHSTAGAQLACRRYGDRVSKLLAYAIAGHHAGLPDGIGGERATLAERLTKRVEPFDRWPEAVTLPADLRPKDMDARQDRLGFQLAFFTRMLFSCLVDADFLETERFARGEVREAWPALAGLAPRLEARLTAMRGEGEVNRQRARILAHVRERASLQPGLFSLTVPTGGGKTLTSLAWALAHARAHGLERVVYVIPFTSVVEQTAEVFRGALGDEAVLEHHSAFDAERWSADPAAEERRSGEERQRQAVENWDAPVVVTTAVQLFESLFAARPARCRKLHHLARAVVVLDEAQTLPLPALKPCVAALDELALNYRSSVVLMTATQPALQEPDLGGGLTGVRELAPANLDREPAFQRVAVQCHREPVCDATLAKRLRAERQALCIVNSRRHARELYLAISTVGDAFHLSTFMCAVHRREMLGRIKERLRAGLPTRLISTSLIEAGVDISFPLVLRAEAGLDQIAQAAGRCNREGELPGLGSVEVFATSDHAPMIEIGQRAAARRDALRRYGDEPLSSAAIAAFFQALYRMKGEAFDRIMVDGKPRQVLQEFNAGASRCDFPFATVAEHFRMIEDTMVRIIIPYDEDAHAALRGLEHGRFVGKWARKLQPYAAQVPRQLRAALLGLGAVQFVRDQDYPGQFAMLANLDLYKPDLGLTWDDPTAIAAERLTF